MSHIINYRLNQFSWAAAAVLLLPLLFTQGMFFDGLTFSTIARNLNEGIGQFWSPQYTPFVHPEYYEHPPFSFAIHSVYYRLFGDQPWVDRFYAYTLYGLSILMIRRIWALLIPSGHRGWIPQLLWTLTPTVLWVHQNNILEAPLNAATLAVVWLLIEGTWKKNYFWSALAGILFFIALGIKGPVALFPLIVLPLVAVLYKEYRTNALISAIIMILSCSLLFTYFFMYVPDFAKFFEGYLNQQLLPSLRGLRGAESSVLLSLLELAKQLLLPTIVLVILAWRRGGKYPLRRESILMFIVAICATVPFLFLHRQEHYYFMPSMAYWMLAFGMLYEQAPWPWGINRKRWVKYISLTNLTLWLAAIVLTLYFSKSPSRDKHTIKAYQSMASDFKLQVVQVRDLNDFWKDNAIASRYNKLYLTERAQTYFLVRLGGPAPEGFEVEATFEKAKLVLYKKATPY